MQGWAGIGTGYITADAVQIRMSTGYVIAGARQIKRGTGYVTADVYGD